MSIRACVGLSLCVLALARPAAEAQSRTRNEYEVKAAYLVEFGRYVSRSDGADAATTFDVCLLGADRFGRTLDTITADATVEDRAVAVRRVKQPRDARACDVLFISDSEQPSLSDILRAVDEAAVLTVSDMPQFASRGGMIQFVTRGGKVQFEINVVAARDAGLTLGAKLLNVASAVHNGLEIRRR